MYASVCVHVFVSISTRFYQEFCANNLLNSLLQACKLAIRESIEEEIRLERARRENPDDNMVSAYYSCDSAVLESLLIRMYSETSLVPTSDIQFPHLLQ